MAGHHAHPPAPLGFIASVARRRCGALHAVQNLPFRPVIKFIYGARVENEANIPATGGVILASNHLDAGDTVVLPAMVKRPVTFPAKAELFAGNRGPFSKLVAWFLKAVGQVPLDRSGGRARSRRAGAGARGAGRRWLCAIYPPRHPDRPTAGCTRARPAWPAWRWRRRCPWCRSP